MPHHDPDELHDEPATRRRVPAGKAILVVFTTILMTLFLDADGLVQTAERQKLGWERSVSLAVMHPIQDISHALRLNRPRKWLADGTGRSNHSEITSTEGVVIATTTPSTPGSSTAQTTTTTTLPSFRVPTSGNPLRVLVAGDSLSGHLGPSISDHLAGLPARVTLDDHLGTGLARPDVVDWPTELTRQMESTRPEVVILIFGGNDNQDLRTAEGWIHISDYPAWKAEYQRRIAQILDIVTKPGVSVWWIGLPVMDRPALQKVVPDINTMIQLETDARHGQVHFVDPDQALAAPDGSYRTFASPPGGSQQRIRENDGVHPTRAGMDMVVDTFIQKLIEIRHLDPPPAPTTTTVAVASRPAPEKTGKADAGK